MFLFLLACLVSGDINKEKIEFEVGSIDVEAKISLDNSIQKSSLQLLFTSDEGEILGHGSGNYFKVGSHRFVLTAAHVALSEYSISVDDGEEYVEMKLAYIDADSDIAIVVPKKNLTSIEPKRWRVNKSKNLVGETLKYVGYPSGLGKLLIRGMASADREEALIMQSFALPGSSGSVVFDSKGRVVGIISAVMMNQSPFSPYPNMEENIVFVPRVDFMNKTFIKEVLRCAGK